MCIIAVLFFSLLGANQSSSIANKLAVGKHDGQNKISLAVSYSLGIRVCWFVFPFFSAEWCGEQQRNKLWERYSIQSGENLPAQQRALFETKTKKSDRFSKKTFDQYTAVITVRLGFVCLCYLEKYA